MKNYYGYEDVVQAEQGIFGDGAAGISGTSAMTEFSRAKPEPDQNGVLYKITCESCGQKKIVVTWPELLCLKHAVSPHIAQVSQDVWGPAQFAPGEWAPAMECSCRWPIVLSISPGEIEALVRQGIMRHWIDGGMFQQIAARCQQVKGMMGR